MSDSRIDVPVEELREQWALALMGSGIIVRIGVKSWHGWSSLTQEDIGLQSTTRDFSQWAKRNIKWGSHRIMPTEASSELGLIRKNIRDNIKSHSFSTLWGDFLPFQTFEAWHEAHQTYQDQYVRAGQELAAKRDEILHRIDQEYRVLATNIWRTIYGGTEPSEAWLASFLNRIKAKVPSADKIGHAFRVNTTFLSIPMPSFIEADMAMARDMQRDRENKDHEQVLAMQAKETISRYYVQEKTHLIDSFLQSTVVSLREHVQETCQKILESMGKHQARSKNDNAITYTHIRRIKELIENTRKLNFFEDEKISELISDLEGEVSDFRSNVNTKAVECSLAQLQEVADETLEIPGFNPTVDYIDL